MTIQSTKSIKQQSGMVLVITLILVVVMTITGISVMNTTNLDEKIVGNAQEKQRAFEAADSATRYAISVINSLGTNAIMKFPINTSKPAFYDLRSSGLDTSTGNKLIADWEAIQTAWPWSDTNKRGTLPSNLGVASSLTYIQDTDNPMNLSITPQFAIGMRTPVTRKGSEGYKCVPLDIIGAAKGSSINSKAIIEIKTVLKGLCDEDLFKS